MIKGLDMKLSKTERKFIAPAVCYNWKIESTGRSGRFAWDGDPLCLVTVGKVCMGLVKKGILSEYHCHHYSWFKLTDLGLKYKCSKCHRGGLFKFNEDLGADDYSGKCGGCDGIGVFHSIKNGTIDNEA